MQLLLKFAAMCLKKKLVPYSFNAHYDPQDDLTPGHNVLYDMFKPRYFHAKYSIYGSLGWLVKEKISFIWTTAIINNILNLYRRPYTHYPIAFR